LFAVSAFETDWGTSRREDFWFIVAVRSEDEAEIRTGQSAGRTGMEGACITHVELHRADLRFPFQSDFAARLTGQRIVGLARRAQFLMADIASGDVLMMHLGTSGSFRVHLSVRFTIPAM
jgi:formamidopyrimidine-DNA glycosylase